jgi:hypothetical protein
MTRDEVLAICLYLPAAEETYPFGNDVVVIKVGGRMFALVPLLEEPGIRLGYTRTSGTRTTWTSTARLRRPRAGPDRGLLRPGRRWTAAFEPRRAGDGPTLDGTWRKDAVCWPQP